MPEKSSRDNFRKMLHEKKVEIIRNSADVMKKFMSGENRQTIAAGQDEGDCSVFYQFEHMSCRQFDLQLECIRKIELALKRLDEGSYGYCEECGEEISMERLKVIPFALLCRDCQEAMEQQPRQRN
ncbi:MAG TPA: TraR/DksA family transcriptional regulator [Dissulfurispiraceae bacterium]|nr:TraR/DksA family transcriptional regulator [Dissulfurispiraceae bacterium]